MHARSSCVEVVLSPLHLLTFQRVYAPVNAKGASGAGSEPCTELKPLSAPPNRPSPSSPLHQASRPHASLQAQRSHAGADQGRPSACFGVQSAVRVTRLRLQVATSSCHYEGAPCHPVPSKHQHPLPHLTGGDCCHQETQVDRPPRVPRCVGVGCVRGRCTLAQCWWLTHTAIARPPLNSADDD